MNESCAPGNDSGTIILSKSPEQQLNGLSAQPCSNDGKLENEKIDVEDDTSSTCPIDAILRKFVEEEKELTPADYTKRFYMIRLEQESLRQEPEYSSASACNPVHYMRNRYRDILPYDHNRVKLSSSEENPDGYMNASVIKLPGGKTKFIAAQAPLSSTVEEWWQMVAEQKIDLIVMLCKLVEMTKVKCERYWPVNEGESLICGNFEVTLIKEERYSDSDYLLRQLKVDNTESKESRVVNQLHYIEWPDHGCPSGENQLLNMIEKMAEIHTNEDVPILVHCSAGVGRTGTIIAVNHIRELLAANSLTELNLFELVMSLRKQRASMVQTQDQYQFVHKCVAQYARRRLGIPEHPQPEAPPSRTDSISPEQTATTTEVISDESDSEKTAVPDFPLEPPAPRGPEELGSAAS